jgi:hypothetical protein
MSLNLATFTFALLQALGIHARVISRDGLIERPAWVAKAVAQRLRQGVRALEAYLRRVLILMALELEPGLVVVVRPENLARAKARPPRARTPMFQIYPTPAQERYPDFERDMHLDRGPKEWVSSPVAVPIGRWLDRLDHLHAIAKAPTAKARRLAFALARRRPGLLMAPPERPRILHRWGREASALHDAMAMQIVQKSRTRPPPLPPPRRGKPMITLL